MLNVNYISIKKIVMGTLKLEIPVSESWFHNFLAVWPWISHLAPLNLHFLSFEGGLAFTGTISQVCEVKWSESHSVVPESLWPHGLHSPWKSPGQNTGVDSLSLLQEIFPTQGSNLDILHCRILYLLSHQGSSHRFVGIQWDGERD